MVEYLCGIEGTCFVVGVVRTALPRAHACSRTAARAVARSEAPLCRAALPRAHVHFVSPLGARTVYGYLLHAPALLGWAVQVESS